VRVFPDTNVLVSAFTSRGLCADIVRLLGSRLRYQRLSAEIVIGELRRVLLTKFKMPAEVVDRVERLLREGHVEPKPRKVPDLKLTGHADLLVIASALNAKADVLITGDKEILAAAPKLQGLKVMTPREFFEMERRRRSEQAR